MGGLGGGGGGGGDVDARGGGQAAAVGAAAGAAAGVEDGQSGLVCGAREKTNCKVSSLNGGGGGAGLLHVKLA